MYIHFVIFLTDNCIPMKAKILCDDIDLLYSLYFFSLILYLNEVYNVNKPFLPITGLR